MDAFPGLSGTAILCDGPRVGLAGTAVVWFIGAADGSASLSAGTTSAPGPGRRGGNRWDEAGRGRRFMKICIFGLGAMGGLLASRLVNNDAVELSVIARGAHLAAVRERGLTVLGQDGPQVVRLVASDRPADFGPQDVVLNCLKAQDSWTAAPSMLPLFGKETAVVTCQNGLPWWYFDGLAGPWTGRRLTSIDADDRQRNAIGTKRVVGCCIYPAGEIVEPGVIRHRQGLRFELGEPSGATTPRITALTEAMEASGLEAPISDDIRSAIWLKLWGNLCFNPISALTRATLDVIVKDPGTRALARSTMIEAQAIAERVGARFAMDVDERIQFVLRVGAHRTSMLQDLESGKPMEIGAIIGSVQEMGGIVGVRTPFIDALVALVSQLEDTRRRNSRSGT